MKMYLPIALALAGLLLGGCVTTETPPDKLSPRPRLWAGVAGARGTEVTEEARLFIKKLCRLGAEEFRKLPAPLPENTRIFIFVDFDEHRQLHLLKAQNSPSAKATELAVETIKAAYAEMQLTEGQYKKFTQIKRVTFIF